jgi:ubiquinone/menaquinone biosynthesis C-methylase UbiE
MAQSGWQFSSDAPRSYEKYIVSALFDHRARELIATAGLRPGERVLDFACGTGIVARHALRAVAPGGRADAFDVNDGMLEVARATSANGGVRFQAGDAAAAPVAEHSFDVVLCQQGLQYFPDRPAALREMRRALVPGGAARSPYGGPSIASPTSTPCAMPLRLTPRSRRQHCSGQRSCSAKRTSSGRCSHRRVWTRSGSRSRSG